MPRRGGKWSFNSSRQCARVCQGELFLLQRLLSQIHSLKSSAWLTKSESVLNCLFGIIKQQKQKIPSALGKFWILIVSVDNIERIRMRDWSPPKAIESTTPLQWIWLRSSRRAYRAKRVWLSYRHRLQSLLMNSHSLLPCPISPCSVPQGEKGRVFSWWPCGFTKLSYHDHNICILHTFHNWAILTIIIIVSILW